MIDYQTFAVNEYLASYICNDGKPGSQFSFI